jgi:hypothetical protein
MGSSMDPKEEETKWLDAMMQWRLSDIQDTEARRKAYDHIVQLLSDGHVNRVINLLRKKKEAFVPIDRNGALYKYELLKFAVRLMIREYDLPTTFENLESTVEAMILENKYGEGSKI